MSRGNNWVGLDKNLIQEFKHIKREFSMIEAMFSYSFDIDCGNTWSISGYSVIWGWSRNKVRRFLNSIGTESGHSRDGKRTQSGQAIHFIDNALMNKKDTIGTESGQGLDTIEDTTIDPKPKPKKEKGKIKKFIPPSKEDVIKYFLEKGYKKEVAEKAFDFYNVADWVDSKGNKIKSWKQKMIGVWFKDENKETQQPQNPTEEELMS